MTTTTSQAGTITRWYVRSSSRVLAVTILISALISLLLGDARGWNEPVPASDPGIVMFSFSTTLIGVPLGAVGIAAFFLAIVQTAGYTRALVAHGATRTSLTIAQLAHGLWLAVVTGLLSLLVLILEVNLAGGWILSTFGLAEGDTVADGIPTVIRGFGLVLLSVLAGSVIAGIFLRWPWWVGVGLLVTVLWVLPWLSVWFRPLADLGSALAAWPGAIPTGVVLLAATHWFVMRRTSVP